MCMDTIRTRNCSSHLDGLLCLMGEGNATRERVGYKIFERTSDSCKFAYYRGHVPFKFNEWLRAIPAAISSQKGQVYEAGFHIYKRAPRHNVSSYVVFRVRYRGVICSGIDGNWPTVVAREMMILPGEVV